MESSLYHEVITQNLILWLLSSNQIFTNSIRQRKVNISQALQIKCRVISFDKTALEFKITAVLLACNRAFVKKYADHCDYNVSKESTQPHSLVGKHYIVSNLTYTSLQALWAIEGKEVYTTTWNLLCSITIPLCFIFIAKLVVFIPSFTPSSAINNTIMQYNVIQLCYRIITRETFHVVKFCWPKRPTKWIFLII